VKCASCGAEIAEKAIVCYRCGAPTAAPAPARPPARRSQSRGRLVVLLVILAAAVILLVFTYWRRSFA